MYAFQFCNYQLEKKRFFHSQKCFTLVCWQFVSGLQSSGYQHTEGEGLDNEVFTQRWPELLHLTFITLHNDIQHVYDI